MNRVNADIEALKSLREALVDFINRQKEALEAAKREIDITIGMLSEAEHHWYHQIGERQRALEQCRMRAAHAAAQGQHSVDCSSYAHALHEAEERLKYVRQWQRRVDEAAAAYHRTKYHTVSLLERDMSQARSFLDHRIQALEAYLATRLSSSASSYSLPTSTKESGIAIMVGSIINAVQGCQRELQHALGSIGEEVAVQVLSTKFGLQPSKALSGTHGFGQVLNAPGMALIVVEPQTNKGGFEQVIEHRLAQLAQSLSAEEMPKVAVVPGSVKGLADVYARKENGKWQLLKSDQEIDQVLSSASQKQEPPSLQREDQQDSTKEGM